MLINCGSNLSFLHQWTT